MTTEDMQVDKHILPLTHKSAHVLTSIGGCDVIAEQPVAVSGVVVYRNLVVAARHHRRQQQHVHNNTAVIRHHD